MPRHKSRPTSVNLTLHGPLTRCRRRLGRLGAFRTGLWWLVIVVCLLHAAPVSAIPPVRVEPGVMAGGGGMAASSLYSVTDTTGQSAIGPANALGYGVADGFWSALGSVPVVPAIALVVAADQVSTWTTANLLVGATDADGDPLAVTAVSPGSEQGGGVILAEGLVAYTPPGGFTGTDAFTYTVTDAGGDTALGRVTLTVSAAPVAAVVLDRLSQTYDGTARVVTATTIPAGLGVALTYNGSPQPPTNAGTYTVVGTVSDATYQGGALGALVVHPSPVTPTVTLNDKVYDGTVAAATLASRSLSGVWGDDEVSLGDSGAAGAFASPHIGSYSPGVSGLRLSGAAAANYSLTAMAAGASARITARPLAIAGLAVRDRLYDGTTTAALTGPPGFPPGAVVVGDEVSLVVNAPLAGEFADVNVGTNKPVTYTSGLTLSGSAADNYWLAGWSGTGSILAFKTNDPSTTAIAVANSAPFDLTLSSGTVLANNDPAGGSLNGTGTIYVNQGATLGGRGRVGGLVLNRGGVLSPGESPGTLTAATATWAGGGSYRFEMNDATGTAGADPGWDLLQVSGALTIAATSGDRFTVQLVSLGVDHTAGAAAHFNAASSHVWPVAVAGSVSGAASGLRLDTNLFLNGVAGGRFSLEIVGSAVQLRFTPGGPTLALVAAMDGQVVGGTVVVAWQTATELGTLAFDLYRRGAGGVWELVNAEPVWALDAVGGGTYRVADAGAAAPGTYTYKLVEWTQSGQANEVGLYTLAIGSPVRITGCLQEGRQLHLSWTGGVAPYGLEQRARLPLAGGASLLAGADGWVEVRLADPAATQVWLPLTQPGAWFRVRSGR